MPVDEAEIERLLDRIIETNGSARITLSDGKEYRFFPRELSRRALAQGYELALVTGVLADLQTEAEEIIALPVVAIDRVVDEATSQT